MTVAPTATWVALPDGVRLHVRRWRPTNEQGAPFLAVHGLASNARLWDGVAQRLAAAGHEVAAVDLRAHGRSDPSDRLDRATLCDDLGTVIRELELDRPIALGQSWGGNLVVELADRAPDTVRSVVAVDGGTIELADRYPDADTAWQELAPPRWDELRFSDVADRLEQQLAGWPPEARAAQLANLVAQPDGTAASVLTRARHRRILTDLHGHRPSRQLARLTLPVLLLQVAGDDDTWATSRRRRSEQATLDNPRVRLHWIHDRHHDVHAQDPDLVVTLLRRSLDEGLIDPGTQSAA